MYRILRYSSFFSAWKALALLSLPCLAFCCCWFSMMMMSVFPGLIPDVNALYPCVLISHYLIYHISNMHMQLPGPMKQQNVVLWICPFSVHAAEINSLKPQCKVYADKKMFYARGAVSHSSLRRGSARSTSWLHCSMKAEHFFPSESPLALLVFKHVNPAVNLITVLP